jgi:hypothetical protein
MRSLISPVILSDMKYRNVSGIPQRAIELVREGRYPDMARAMKHMTMKHETDRAARRRFKRAVRRAADLHIKEQLAAV